MWDCVWMGRSGPTRLVEFRVREDLVAAVRQAAGARDVTLSHVTARALEAFLEAPTLYVLVAAVRVRLAVRLPVELIGRLQECATLMGVSPRLLVEASLLRAFAPAREPTWRPTRPVSGTS